MTSDKRASDLNNCDHEPPATPRNPVELSSPAKETLRIFHHRTPLYLEALRVAWRDAQDSKHNIDWVDQEGIYRDLGALMTMTNNQGKLVFDIVIDNKDESTLGTQTKAVSQMVEKLRGVSKGYRYQVYGRWHILNKRRTCWSASMFMYKDLGTLMQMNDEEAEEIMRILETTDKSKLMGPRPVWDQAFLPESQVSKSNAKKRPRDLQVTGMSNLSIEPPSKKPNFGDGFRPMKDDWKCGICEYWNRSHWSICHNGGCNGTMRDDSVEVHRWVMLA
jgi:hypothetical protein